MGGEKLDILQMEELNHPIGNGITNPILGINSNIQYVVKTNNNIEGNKVLVNELVCYLLAIKLGLPIPEAGLCNIDINTNINRNVYEVIEDFSEDCYGLGFYSKWVKNATVISSEKMIKLSSNYKWLIPKIMLFDHIIYNNDRNKGNLLIKMNKLNRELILIDHSHTFNLGALWDKYQLRRKIEEEDYKDDFIMRNNAYLYSKFKNVMSIDMVIMQETIDYFRKNITIEDIREVINYIPKYWEINKDDLEALIDYIVYRFEHIDYFANIIASYVY